jgi:hypothetical protein
VICSDVINNKLYGIQLTLFEIIWPCFPWMTAIRVKGDAKACMFHVQVTHFPTEDDQEDCERLLGEILDAVLDDAELRLVVTYDRCPPMGSGYREVMSELIFKKIAADVAPWRLEAGR